MSMLKERGYSAIGLFNPKTPSNVGSILRDAGCFGSSFVAMTGHRFHRAPTDTLNFPANAPLLQVQDLREVIPHDCVPVAVELVDGARPLTTYTHPDRAIYIFGPEDGTLGKSVTSWCRDVIYVPTEYCMNLAVTAGVVLYDRMAKRARQEHQVFRRAA